jgi:hypothetical protein
LSHIVTIETKIHNPIAIGAACSRLNLAAPVYGKAQLFTEEAEGMVIQLPGWRYPAIIEPVTGEVHYDNYGGAWGEQAQLNLFLQAYSVELCLLEARKKGFAVSEQTLVGGSIRLQILEGSVG